MRAAAAGLLLASFLPVAFALGSPGSPAASPSGAAPPPPREQRAAVERLVGTMSPVYCGGQRGNAVALTFDDGPGPFTGAALDALRRARARATFFAIGSHVARYPELARREAREQIVANHSWSHPVLTQLREQGVFAQLARAKREIVRAGARPLAWLFRPPYGAFDDRVLRAATTLDMVPVLWSVYTGDTTPIAAAQIVANVTAGARPGSVILLHENNNQGVTLSALPAILAVLEQRGLRSVTLPELLAADPPTRRQLATGPYGCGPTVGEIQPSSGPAAGGTTVTINGEQLAPATGVYFGTQRASAVTVVSSHQLVATSPPGAASADVTVVTHFGTSPVSAADVFTYG